MNQYKHPDTGAQGAGNEIHARHTERAKSSLIQSIRTYKRSTTTEGGRQGVRKVHEYGNEVRECTGWMRDGEERSALGGVMGASVVR